MALCRKVDGVCASDGVANCRVMSVEGDIPVGVQNLRSAVAWDVGQVPTQSSSSDVPEPSLPELSSLSSS